ncbi:MAG: hypothetical protein ABIK09_16180 [Pseudomonadota bacterium]
MNGDDSQSTLLDDEAVAAYVDGEMQPEERRRFEERLAGDPALAVLVAEYREMVELLHADGQTREVLPPAFLVAVQRRIRLKSKGQWYGGLKPRFPYETFGVLAVILVLLYAGFDVLFPGGATITVTATRRVSLAVPVPGDLQQLLDLEGLRLSGANAMGWSLVLDRKNLDGIRPQILPLLEPEDREWLESLSLDEGQSIRLYLLPGEVDLLPATMEFRVAPEEAGDDP